MTLNNKYRPRSLKEFYGNETSVEALTKVLQREKDVPSSFFFTGPPGCGKTTLAYVIKEELGIHDHDFYSYNTGNTRGIDTIRDIVSELSLAPMMGSKKLYLLDECHQITGAAAEALLKPIEQPPSHVHFVLCTSEPEKIKPNTLRAIRRRCFELEVRPLPRAKIVTLLKDIFKEEGFDEYPLEILQKIADSCWGSPGQALSLLDSVIDMEDIDKILESIENLVVSEESVIDLCRLLVDNRLSVATKWEKATGLLKGITADPESVRYAILGYIEKVLLGEKMPKPELLTTASMFTDSFQYTGRCGLVMATYFACNPKGEDDIPF